MFYCVRTKVIWKLRRRIRDIVDKQRQVEATATSTSPGASSAGLPPAPSNASPTKPASAIPRVTNVAGRGAQAAWSNKASNHKEQNTMTPQMPASNAVLRPAGGGKGGLQASKPKIMTPLKLGTPSMPTGETGRSGTARGGGGHATTKQKQVVEGHDAQEKVAGCQTGVSNVEKRQKAEVLSDRAKIIAALSRARLRILGRSSGAGANVAKQKSQKKEVLQAGDTLGKFVRVSDVESRNTAEVEPGRSKHVADENVRCANKLVWEDTVKWIQHIRRSIVDREQFLEFLQITAAEQAIFDKGVGSSKTGQAGSECQHEDNLSCERVTLKIRRRIKDIVDNHRRELTNKVLHVSSSEAGSAPAPVREEYSHQKVVAPAGADTLSQDSDHDADNYSQESDQSQLAARVDNLTHESDRLASQHRCAYCDRVFSHAPAFIQHVKSCNERRCLDIESGVSVGEKILKEFPPFGLYEGTVTKTFTMPGGSKGAPRMVMCRIRYHDNDEEDLPIADVLPLLKQTEDLSTDADTTAYAATCSRKGTCSGTSAAKNLMSYGPVCVITIPT